MSSVVRFPVAKVYLDGIPTKIVDREGAISVTYSIGQPIATGVLRVIDPPLEPKHLTNVTITWGYSGEQLVYGMTGFVINPTRQSYMKQWTLNVQDVLFLANFPVQDEINLLNDKTAKECLTILLRDWSGIPEERLILPELEQAPGVPWMLGTLTPILFQGMSPLQACLQICSVLGYWLYCDPAGYIRALQIRGAPTENTVYDYVAGSNIFLSAAPTVDRDLAQLYNRAVVTGANTGYNGVQIHDEWRVDLPETLSRIGKDNTFTYSNSLIEYTSIENGGAASCEAVAHLLVREHGRDPFAVTIPQAAAEPRKVFVGATVGVQDARIGLGTKRPFFVMGFTRSFGGGKFRDSNILLDGGLGPDGYTDEPDPIPVIVTKLARETLDGTTYVELFLDGSQSYAYGGNPDIISWVWSDDQIPQQTAEGKYAVFLYDLALGLTIVHITLLVTDIVGKSAAITIPVSLTQSNGGPLITRVLNFAAGNAWYVTPDGGAVWNSESGSPSTAVPPISAGGGAGAPSGSNDTYGLLTTDIRRTLDYLATPSTAIGNVPGSPVNFLWQHETDPNRVWAAVGDQVYLSLDAGVTWELRGVPSAGATVYWIVEAYNNIGTLDVLAGNKAYTSFDNGTTYVESLAGPTGTTARCYTSGFDRHWVGFTGVMAPASPLRSFEGGIAAFPEVDPPVTAIQAVTMLVEEPTMYAFDAQGRIWKLDVADGGSVEQVATMPDA